MNDLPTFTDVLRARQTIAPYLRPSPLYQYQSLSDALGAQVWIKHENHLPTGAFKVRGGVNFMAHLDPAARARGVITASTGNHGQSVAYAAHLFGVKVVVAMPKDANPAKVESIRSFGADIHFVGQDFDDCRKYVEENSGPDKMHYLSSGDEPLLVAGVGTYSLEIMESLPEVDVIIVPIGGGSGASGACLVAKTINPKVQVIGVQAEAAPSAYLSWKEKRRVEAKMETFAEGLATRAPFDLPQAILRRDLADFILVSEDEIRAAMLLAMEKTRSLVEAAGASPLAAALKIRERLQGKCVALVMSGGNVTMPQLKALLDGA
jgi:threonine dehydratase